MEDSSHCLVRWCSLWGLSIVVVNIARSRVRPPENGEIVFLTATAPATRTLRPLVPTTTGTAGPDEPDTVVGVVRSYEPGGLIIVIVPTEGEADQVIVPENIEVVWLSGVRASPREIVPGQTLYAEGELDPLVRLVAQRIVIVEDAPAGTATPMSTNTPTPTAAAGVEVPAAGLEGAYYANWGCLASQVTRLDRVLSFEWGWPRLTPISPSMAFRLVGEGAGPLRRACTPLRRVRMTASASTSTAR